MIDHQTATPILVRSFDVSFIELMKWASPKTHIPESAFKPTSPVMVERLARAEIIMEDIFSTSLKGAEEIFIRERFGFPIITLSSEYLRHIQRHGTPAVVERYEKRAKRKLQTVAVQAKLLTALAILRGDVV